MSKVGVLMTISDDKGRKEYKRDYSGYVKKRTAIWKQDVLDRIDKFKRSQSDTLNQ